MACLVPFGDNIALKEIYIYIYDSFSEAHM